MKLNLTGLSNMVNSMMKYLFLAVMVGLSLNASSQHVPRIETGGPLIKEWRQLATGGISAVSLVKPQFGTASPCPFKSGSVILPVNFKGTTFERGCWDLPVDVDMTRAKGITFDLFCSDMSVFTGFTLYLHADGEWIAANFMPDASDVWSHIVIKKSAFKADTNGRESSGFSHIDIIRISGWRARDVDSVCALANVAILPSEPEVLLVQGGGSAENEKDEKQFLRYADNLQKTLMRIGIESVSVRDKDLKESSFAGINVVAFPYSTSLPSGVLALLQKFTDNGGKVIAFYTLNDGLDKLLGVRHVEWLRDESGQFAGFAAHGDRLQGQPDFAPQRSWNANVYELLDPASGKVCAVWRGGNGVDTDKPAVIVTPGGAVFGHVWLNDGDPGTDQLMLSILGEVNPMIWERKASALFRQIGCFDHNKSYAEFLKAFQGETLHESTRSLLKQLEKAYIKAEKELKARDWPESCSASLTATDLAVKAWCSRFKSVPGEHRAFWCHSAYGLKDYGWDKSVKFLKENGFNVIIPNMSWGTTAYYPSKVLPVHESVKERGDQIKLCLEACRKYGVECHIWKVCWNTGHKVDKEMEAQLRSQGRIQVSQSGSSDDVWLCPSHPENQRMEIEAQLEVARNYDVDGVHFDYIRYPGNQFCYCDGCRKRFEKFLGAVVDKWPEQVLKNGEHYEKWLDFRRDNISKVVRTVALEVPKIRKGVEISAAVFRNAGVDRNTIGQDWQLWCEKGWLDFVCPMDYIDSCAAFRNTVGLQKEYVGKVPLYPGIGLSCWRDESNYAIKLCQQISIAREAGLKGYTVFNYDARAEQVLPLVSLGTTKD